MTSRTLAHVIDADADGEWDMPKQHLALYAMLGVSPDAPVELVELAYEERMTHLDKLALAARSDEQRAHVETTRAQLVQALILVRRATLGPAWGLTGEERPKPVFSPSAAIIGGIIVAAGVAFGVFMLLEYIRACSAGHC